jgi:hypothetical protein
MIRSRFILLFLLLISGWERVLAQSDSEDNAIDSNYIVSYKDVFTPRLVFITKRNEFDVENVSFDSNSQNTSTLTFKPNDPLSIGVGFTYKWLGINLAFNVPSGAKSEELYGKTKRFDLGTHIYGRKLIVDLTFQWYRGYYLSNPQGIIPGWEQGDPYPSRNDVRVSTYGTAAFYVFKNQKFSYRAAFTYNERQKKSAGSAIVGAGISGYFIRSDSSIINKEYLLSMGSEGFNKVNIGNYYAVGGYAHTFVIKYFYLSLTLGVGLGVNSSKVFFEDSGKTHHSGASLVSLFRTSFGYNNDRFYVGLSLYNSNFSLGSQPDIGVNYRYTSLNINIGYRFYHMFDKKEPLPWLWDLKI